ncbi:MAG: sigma factor-like helix-turn-helix DNA-binding protein, partial [Thermodesulfobacteriota bacterium]
ELTSEKDASHLDFLTGGEANQEELLTKAEEEENVRKGMAVALKTLKDRERYIIEKRVLSDQPLTLEELGTKFNISRERVRQIESAALKKIKDVLEEKGISK